MRRGKKDRGEQPSSFDFIIVGAGTAGCILADRLSAEGHTVLVLEAGARSANPLLALPIGVGRVWNAPAYNWSYVSEPESQLGKRTLQLPRGRLVGGSSAINAMNYVRGNSADFDGWADAGLRGWSYADLLPCFRRLEAFEQGPDTYRGASGAVPVSVASHDDPLVPALFSALDALEFRETKDYNGETQTGFARAQFNIRAGRRQDAARCFLDPAISRGGVTLMNNCRVDRIRISHGRAMGVVFSRNGRIGEAQARREVILSAGAFNTPQILMLSGIGPAAELKQNGIDVVTDSPGVGSNLIDHPRIAVEFARRDRSSIYHTLRADRLPLALAKGLLMRSGPAIEPLAAAHLFLHSNETPGAPDLQFLFRLFNPRLEVWLPFRPPQEPDCFGIVACLLHPESRGTVRLRSDDPSAAPLIRTNILADEADRAKLARALEIARRIGAQPPLRDRLAGEVGASANAQDELSVHDFMRDTADTIFHPAGTCAMGTDSAAPLTADLKLRGIEALRVVDASVMPTPISGNINAAVMVVAEKAAELILGDARPWSD